MHQKIGLLATGNEITEGDILNTNGQSIASDLVDQGFRIGMHIIVADRQADIETAMRFLLQEHSIIIITGGLGPTSDDRTRYALSTVINEPLIFNEDCWREILERYQRIGRTPHPDNRQQALFPQNAIIFKNNHGTAAGCCVTFQQKLLYMLPGPPNECLPMFKEMVLPSLLQTKNNKQIKLKWRLLGALEGEIAAQIDAAVQPYPVTTGYRVDFPYVEVKISSDEQTILNEILPIINPLIKPYVISENNQTASELLKTVIASFAGIITIVDYATHGALETELVTQATYAHLRFITQIADAKPGDILIEIRGLDEYWHGKQPLGGSTQLTLTFRHIQQTETVTLELPFRNIYVRKYAVEYSARAILRYLEKMQQG